MGHKTLIGGTVYEISGGKTLVGGTAYGISGGKTLVGGTAHSIAFSGYDPVFSNNSWSAIIEACQNNAVPVSWDVGAQKPMTINGKDYLIDIIGRTHDAYTDGSGMAPLTFQMHECYSLAQMDSVRIAGDVEATNLNGWEGSTMRKDTMSNILTKMPSEVQAAIKEVNKLTNEGGKSTVIETTADKLFLLSISEIVGSNAAEGSQYELYALGASVIKTYNGNAYTWWTRTPDTTGVTSFRQILNTGATGSATSITNRGVAPAFCF